MKNNYLVIDIGTGNVRVGLADEKGSVISIERDAVQYVKDEAYPDALYFDPILLWSQIEALAKKILLANKDLTIKAVTSGSQREGVVLIDADGEDVIGFPNHDHRGKEWEGEIPDKDAIYHMTGRYPGSLFSAMKILALKRKQPAVFARVACVMSISDWAAFKLTGVKGYEHSQASETQLYDIEKKQWSDELCAAFSIDKKILPPLQTSGTVLGPVSPKYISEWKLPPVPFVTGGADTQLAVQSTQPQPGDIVIVSGTTTPIVKIISDYITDPQQRTWTNRHTDAEYFILETNAGVTGLNLQRLKEVFYPNEGYDVVETELSSGGDAVCSASLGSLIAGEAASKQGGFTFEVPVPHNLTRASFVRAVFSDMASAIKANLEILISISGYEQDFVWACGGGFQSRLFVKHLSGLTGKTIRLRKDFQHASVVGGALACNKALGKMIPAAADYESITP